MRSLPFALVPWLLLAGLLLPDRRGVRLAVAGFLVAGLATASAALVLGDGSAGELAGRITERGVQMAYLTSNAVILLAGLGFGASALAEAWPSTRPAVSVALALALSVAVALSWPLLRESRPVVAMLAAMAVVMLSLAWATWSGGRTSAAHGISRGTWLLASTLPMRSAVAALAVLAVLSPDFGVSLVCMALLALLLYVRTPRRTPIDRLPILPLLAVAMLIAAWLAWRAAGADGLVITALRDAAFSPALQTLLGALLLPALFVMAGVPPFDRFAPGALLAPVATAVMTRSVLPGLPGAVEHWRSAGALWLVLAAAEAVRRHRSGLVLACLALFGLLVAGEEARVASGVLAGLAALIDLTPAPSRATRGWLGRLALGAALLAWGGVLRPALASEVVYSTAMVLVLTVGVLRGAGRPVER
jgi:hypothetical protein